MNTCCLCSHLTTSAPIEPWNKPLFESPNFVALPSLGSLVEGWLLLVPKTHFLNMGALPDHLASELEIFKRSIGEQLQSRYGPICVFEHGPSTPNKSVGCSVDHAHLHLVPIDFSLIDAAIPFLPDDVVWTSANWDDCQAAFLEHRDYLYMEQPMGSGMITFHGAFGSQVFRKAIAARTGAIQQFNWREYPQTETIRRTVLGLSDFSKDLHHF